MKYMLLIHDNADTREVFFGEGGAELRAEMDALMAELTASGELIGGEALADPSNTKTVRVRDGVPAITDGPEGVRPALETMQRDLEIALRSR